MEFSKSSQMTGLDTDFTHLCKWQVKIEDRTQFYLMLVVVFPVELSASRLLGVKPNLDHQKWVELWCRYEKNLKCDPLHPFSVPISTTLSWMRSCSTRSTHHHGLGGPPPLTLDDRVPVASKSYVLSLMITSDPSSLCVSIGHGLLLLLATFLAENYLDVLEN